MSFAYTITGLFIAYGKSNKSMVCEIGGALISTFIYKYLINAYGFIGAAWGHVFAYLGILVIAFFLISKEIKAQFRKIPQFAKIRKFI